MIKFDITITENEQGKVNIECHTPAGIATRKEINTGMRVKEVLRLLAGIGGTIKKDWKVREQ